MLTLAATATSAAGTVTVKDLNGNLLPNQAVTLKLTSTNNAFALDTTTGVVTTGTNGTASFNVFSYGQAGTATVQASLTGVSTPPTQNVTFTAQPNPQLVGSLTSSVSAGSPTPFTMIFRNSRLAARTGEYSGMGAA